MSLRSSLCLLMWWEEVRTIVLGQDECSMPHVAKGCLFLGELWAPLFKRTRKETIRAVRCLQKDTESFSGASPTQAPKKGWEKDAHWLWYPELCLIDAERTDVASTIQRERLCSCEWEAYCLRCWKTFFHQSFKNEVYVTWHRRWGLVGLSGILQYQGHCSLLSTYPFTKKTRIPGLGQRKYKMSLGIH